MIISIQSAIAGEHGKKCKEHLDGKLGIHMGSSGDGRLELRGLL